MGMSTDVIIGHFLKADDDISTIVHSDKFLDTLCERNGYYFSNGGNTVFHWNRFDEVQKEPMIINDEIINKKRKLFELEISGITRLLDFLGIKWEIVYGALADTEC